MTATKSPGALAAPGAPEIDGLGQHVVSKTNRQQHLVQAPIGATLIGSDRCEAAGIIVHGHAPVLGLLRISANGETARLTVADDRHREPRLRCQKGPGGYCSASPVAPITDARGVPTPERTATVEAAP
jgi:hypothetical protein